MRLDLHSQLHPHLAADTGAGSGGAGDDDTDANTAVARLIAGAQGDATRAVLKLYRDNYRLREKNRDLTAQLQQAQGAAPPQGAVVLSGDEAQAWEAYKALGAPKDVEAKLKEGQMHGEELARARRAETLRTVAETARFKPSVLEALDAQAGGLEYEVKDEQQNGQTVKVAYVKDGQGQTPLTQYAEKTWGDFLPSLRAEPQQAGTRFVQQGAGGQPPTSVVDTFLKRAQETRASKPNPLAPKAS